ncbi:MAG: peptide chain release factor N(5)-glutamine methyltransferase [Clostridia bacterium]|nr:peptide chain release factor N(5)-glutamine methyltransferase [Clostridia bacterium]
MTIFEAYNSTKQKLMKAGIEDYVFEAKQIIKHITGLNATAILTNYNRNLTEFQQNNLTALLRQREIRYPLQYIFGEWDFYGRPFYVGPGVLVPRADTETLVEAGLDYLKDKQGPKILDLCAGSGCIGITFACERKDSEVLMVEKFDEAINYAERNIHKNNATNSAIKKGDVFDSVEAEGSYDLIVSNPPYIAESEINEMSPETQFEPQTALLAKDDGLEFYKAIANNYKKALKNGGMLAFEVGFKQSEAVAEILKLAGFADIKFKKDLSDINRVVIGIYEF